MGNLIVPGQGVLFMKVGTHARESLEDIIERKTREIEESSFALWGYGGSTCHPQTMVQPFARDYHRQGGRIYLVMEPMESKHFAEPVRADELSVDGIKWEPIPKPINVKGSRYALVIQNLRKEEFDLPLDRTEVALGNSMGAPGGKYINGRVDKACLRILDEHHGPDRRVHIGLVADIVEPFAVYVRNKID
ncbi:MAG: hypothetical protein JNL64_00155 [Blastocatellia bacterium]|nr:hypothetical protein [Blastocatellia bacterium]